MPYENITDEQLVEMVRENNKEMYSELIKRYQTKLGNYLRKFIKNNYELEDVLQDVFIKAYKNLNAFDTNKKFSSWIYRIAHNEAINQLKKSRNKILSLDEHDWQIIDEKIDIKDMVDHQLSKIKIEKCLTEMKEKYRQPLLLYFFEQKTYEEISDILLIPRSTVGILIMRGKNYLKEKLSDK